MVKLINNFIFPSILKDFSNVIEVKDNIFIESFYNVNFIYIFTRGIHKSTIHINIKYNTDKKDSYVYFTNKSNQLLIFNNDKLLKKISLQLTIPNEKKTNIKILYGDYFDNFYDIL